jgi:hypothetical protein
MTTKHFVYSARTTEKGLALLNKTKGTEKSWDQFVTEAVAAHYKLPLDVLTLPPSKFALEREENRKAKEAEKAQKAKEKADKAAAKAKDEAAKKAKAAKAGKKPAKGATKPGKKATAAGKTAAEAAGADGNKAIARAAAEAADKD